VLKLTPAGWFTLDFRILEGNRELSVIRRQRFREGASFRLDRKEFTVRRTGRRPGKYVLEHDGIAIAEAVPDRYRRKFEVTAGADTFMVESVPGEARRVALRRGNAPLGGVKPDGIFKRTSTAQFASYVSREMQLFVIFLVLLMWQWAAGSYG
jgi:hypothetical protein